MSIFELDSKIAEYREIKTAIEELEKQAESIKDLVKEKMLSEEVEVLTGSGWSATWHTVSSSRLDSKALKAAHPDIYSEFCKTSTTTRFTLA